MESREIIEETVTDRIVTLYHGSKSGIRGPIAPVSRKVRQTDQKVSFWQKRFAGNIVVRGDFSMK